MLVYNDAPGAIDFLCNAFGFTEEFRMPMPDGGIGHAELRYSGSMVMLSSAFPAFGLLSPASLTEHHSQLYCSVDDLDAHYATARANGATIVAEPRMQDHGERSYRALDCEGHRWIFGERQDTDAAGSE
jgi:PhnB protein